MTPLYRLSANIAETRHEYWSKFRPESEQYEVPSSWWHDEKLNLSAQLSDYKFIEWGLVKDNRLVDTIVLSESTKLSYRCLCARSTAVDHNIELETIYTGRLILLTKVSSFKQTLTSQKSSGCWKVEPSGYVVYGEATRISVSQMERAQSTSY